MDEDLFLERYEILRHFPYLPLFYLIPDEIAKVRKLDDIPRDPMIIATDEYWREYYFSKHFIVQLADTWAWMMWQHLGIRGGFDSYSSDDSFVIMCLNISMWAWLLSEIGIDTRLLALYPEWREVPFLSMDAASLSCDSYANLFWNHPTLKMSKIREIIEECRSHDDYSKRNSHIKIDFYRKYYHTRSKTKMIKLEDENGEEVYAPYTPNEFADVEYRLWRDDFLKTLIERDKQIVLFLEKGYTQVEIAKTLGYSNHSGV